MRDLLFQLFIAAYGALIFPIALENWMEGDKSFPVDEARSAGIVYGLVLLAMLVVACTRGTDRRIDWRRLRATVAASVVIAVLFPINVLMLVVVFGVAIPIAVERLQMHYDFLSPLDLYMRAIHHRWIGAVLVGGVAPFFALISAAWVAGKIPRANMAFAIPVVFLGWAAGFTYNTFFNPLLEGYPSDPWLWSFMILGTFAACLWALDGRPRTPPSKPAMPRRA